MLPPGISIVSAPRDFPTLDSHPDKPVFHLPPPIRYNFPNMKSTRPLLFSAFLILLSLGFLLTRGDAQPNSVKQIAPGVWFREGDIQNEGHCNNTIIEMNDYLIVIDANFPSGARKVIEDA